MISIGDDPQAVEIDQPAAVGGILREFFDEKDHIVIVTEPGLGTVKRLDITSNGSGTTFDEPQLVPEGLHLFAPLVKVGGALPLPGACHRLTPALVYRVDARCEGAEAAMPGPPPFGILSSLAELSIHVLPRPVASSRLHRRSFVCGQLTPRPRERVLADQVRMRAPELGENLRHRIGVAQLRQPSTDAAQSFPGAHDAASVVGLEEREDRANLLDALACLVYGRVAWRPRPPQFIARGTELILRKPSQPACDRFLRS
ncbi:MAG TPA: hypothetical protein VKE96_24160 [Vicinamibacterales bacterium]|nr:hypothetical protein [Vicinamibacterales bacterium]